jgi:hypothetical protein
MSAMQTGDDLAKQFEQFTGRTRQALTRLPLLVANEAKNFSLDRFKAQNWIDERTESWKKRKPGSKRDAGRNLLIDTGKGRRAIRIIRADWGLIRVGIDEPEIEKYMSVHNNGFRGIVQVKEQSRIASRKVATRFGKNGRGLKSGQIKIRGRGHQVKPHTRKVNIPQRRFIGNSHYLNLRINRTIINQLNKI